MLDDDALERIWKQARVWSRVRVPRHQGIHSCWTAPAAGQRVRLHDESAEASSLIRTVYEVPVGDVPADTLVVRTCTTKACVNPGHMALRRSRRWSVARKRRVA